MSLTTRPEIASFNVTNNSRLQKRDMCCFWCNELGHMLESCLGKQVWWQGTVATLASFQSVNSTFQWNACKLRCPPQATDDWSTDQSMPRWPHPRNLLCDQRRNECMVWCELPGNGHILESNGAVLEDACWLHPTGDVWHINMAELDAALKDLNIMLQLWVKVVHLYTDS